MPPVTMDIFEGDAFSMQTLTQALESIPYKPQFLGSLGIFEPEPITTEVFSIEQREGTLSLVPTTPRGAPLPQGTRDGRTVRDFRTVRVAKGDTVRASEIQGVRAFGSTTELEQVQREIMRRLMKVRDDVELTHENMRLGAIQGIVLDSDGVTVIRNYFTEFGIAQPNEIDFDLDNANPASGVVRQKCAQVIRAMMVASKGMWLPSTTVHALAGDTFYDQLVGHPEVRQTYLNWAAAADLRGDNVFGSFSYGGITWHNYRGTDDGTTLTVGATKAKFFPVGAPGAFKHGMSPGESFDLVNTPGRAFYAGIVPDKDRNMFADVEVYSYPLYVATRPGMLQRAKNT